MSRELLEAWGSTWRRRRGEPAVSEAASGRVTTFGELEAQAQAWRAAHAGTAGSVAGRVVVFALPNGAEWLRVFLGSLYAGAIAVPLDPGEPPAAQRALAAAIRAGFLWDGASLVSLEAAHRFRNSSLCLVKLTSGSTGRPRPLLFTDAQMLADGRQIQRTMAIRGRDVNYAVIPLGHSYGLGNLTLPLLAHGVAMVIGSVPLPHVIAGDFARWRPTVLPAVPTIFRGLAESSVDAAALRSLRLAISAGAPLAPEVARAFARRFRRHIHSFYGSSETGGITYDRTGAATLSGRSVGRPLHGVRLRVSRGRLRVCSPAVFTHGNRRHAGGLGWWSPPDLAGIAAYREVRLLGRRGAVVKIAGRRVNLGEVAARLRQLPGVRDVWVGTSGETEGVLGAALATDRPTAELRAALRADTAPWKTPKRWLLLPEFPVTARGKTDTADLRRRLFGGAGDRAQ